MIPNNALKGHRKKETFFLSFPQKDIHCIAFRVRRLCDIISIRYNKNQQNVNVTKPHIAVMCMKYMADIKFSLFSSRIINIIKKKKEN